MNAVPRGDSAPEMTAEYVEQRRQCLVRSRKKLLAFLRSQGIPLADAEDAVQESVLCALTRLRDGSVQSIGNRAAWLRRTARNLAMTRRLRRRHQSLTFQPIAPGSDPVERAEASNDREALAQALLTLPEPQRELLRLWSEGLTQREIAQHVGRAPGTISRALAEATKALRAEMKK